jgi:hypothetical protein
LHRRTKFAQQEKGLAKLYAKQVQALAKLYEDEEHARKLYQGEKQTRPRAKFMINVKHNENLPKNWITREVRKIVEDVEYGGWRNKENQSENRGNEVEDEAWGNVLCGGGRKGAKHRAHKDGVGKEGRHVLKVIRNALPAIYPGRTALHMAAANGNVEIVRALCEVDDVDLNKRDVFGYTPLHLACYSIHLNRDKVIKILLAYEQTDVNAVAKELGYYLTPLHLAVKAKSTEIVDMLLD